MLSRFNYLAAILAATLLCSVPARAQEPSPEAVAAASELIVIMEMRENFKSVTSIIFQALKPAVTGNRPELVRDYDAIAPIMIELANARLDEFLATMAAVYARHFTAEDLREVAEFYRRPAGRRFVQKMPVVMQDSTLAGQQFGQKLAGDMQLRIIEELRKRGHNI